MRSTLLLLAACGGQSGENEKGGVPVEPCEEVDAVPLAEVSAEEWPEGTAEAMDAWIGLDGAWSATLRCDGVDEAVTLSFAVDPDELTLRTFAGDCEESRVVGRTGFAIAGASASDEQDLLTTFEWGGVHLSGDGVTILVPLDGPWTAALYGGAGDDVSCELIDPVREEER